MKKKLLVYPFHRDIVSICRYRELLSDYILAKAVAPLTEAYDNRSYGLIDGSLQEDFIINTDFNSSVQECDAVLFVFENELLIEQYKANIQIAKDLHKEIIIEAELLTLLHGQNIDIPYDKILQKANVEGIVGEPFLKNIDIPVIFVYGLGEYCNKFDLQLSLRNFFLEKGYRILQYGTKEISNLFGFECLPSFLFEAKLSMEDKVLLFNEFIYSSIKNTKAELLIIGVPGGILPYDRNFYNHFSEIPYIISSAIKPDISVLSVYSFSGINVQYLKKIKEYAQFKYGAEIGYFNLSNSTYNINYDDSEPTISFIGLPATKIVDIQKSNFPDISDEVLVFNIFDDTLHRAYDHIENELSNNLDIV